MKITKELLARYELDQCTDQEQAAVRQWLDSTDLELDENVLEMTGYADNPKDQAVKQDLWQHISAHINGGDAIKKQPEPYSDSTPSSTFPKRRPSMITWLSVAASTVILLGIGWWTYSSADSEPQVFNASNSDHAVVLWEEDSFEFTLSKNSSASINFQSGNMAVSGDVLFSPKRDIILYNKQNKTSLDFRQGEVYFISTDPDTSELVVYSKTELEYLPPILRKHIRKQFHLT